MGRHDLAMLSSGRAWRATSCSPITPIPTAWSEIGWGGPASPRGYVRMDYRRARSLGSRRSQGRRRSRPRAGRTAVSDDPFARSARRRWPRARCVPSRRLGADAAISAKTRRSISSSSAPAPAAARLPAGLPKTASPSSRSMPARISGRSRISPRTSRSRPSSTGPTTASSTAPIRCRWAATTAAKRSADRPCTSRWCRCAFGPNGSSRAACSAMAPTGRSIGARCGTTTPRSRRR